MAVSAQEAATLDAMPTAEAARVWCALNNDEVPAALAATFPANWGAMTRQARHDFVWALMAYIITRIGIKECLREWNRIRMDDAEFEAWWAGSGNRINRSINRLTKEA